ncbi:HNH endonuclease signature motif containing protein [Pseudoclavibacter helvolus]|uniref:HNH endonuclease signature motif containing protein n=1 Tax=Pseudoclavibacter helvolus TaxID=255205 RepID=UPI0024ACDE2C|nr:HNH endonuclease signature motif containing protein [Pseudoclavibacter helvolus]
MASESFRSSSRETAVVDALLEARTQLSGVPDAEIVVVLYELAARRRVLDAALVEVAGEMLRREDESPRSETVARKAGFRNLAGMAEQVLGVKPFEANTLVRVASATRERMGMTGEPIPAAYAEVSRAVASGVMSVAQAAAITKGLEQTRNRVDVEDVARAEAELVASACGLNPEDEQPAVPKVLEVQAATWVSYLDPDGDEPRAEKVAEERGLWWVRRADGAIAGKFVATPEQGEQLISVLDALLAPRRKVEFPAASECGEPHAPALGANELPLADTQVDDGSDSPEGSDTSDASDASDAIGEVPLVDPRSIEQRRIDALDMILRCYAESPDAPRTGGEAPTIVIVTAETGLAGEAERPEDVPHLERTGEPIPPSFAAKTMCDGFIRIATRTATGEILELGRKQRLFTTAQRRAIFVRDRHCRAPGCGAPARWCEAHHAVPWSEGGPTDVKDGILLCSFHHHEVHRSRLTLILGPDGRWRVVATVGHHVRRRTARRRAFSTVGGTSDAQNIRPRVNRRP